MATTREEEEEQIEFGHPSPSDSYEVLDEEDKEPPQLASRYVGIEDRDAIDVGETEVDRAGPSLAEVRSLGPIEELEGEMFDKAEREVPAGSGTMKEVFVCKFCAEEFNYMMRDMHTHKDACPKYPSRANLTREVQSVPDEENPEMMVDVEVAGEPANTNAEEDEDEEEVKGPDAPLVEDDVANMDKEERLDDDKDVDMGLEPGEEVDEVDEDETQMLDDEPLTVVVPDRIEIPNETDQPRPVLKVATAKSLKPVDESRDVDMVEDVHSTSETEETPKTDARGRGERADAVDDRDSPENASETASTGSAHGGGRDYRTSFRMIPGTEQAECLQCGRVCSNRGGAMASHYKKCPGQHHPTPDRAGASVQLITPKKKAAKRRISGQEYELLEEETNSQANESEDDSQPGSPPLRRSKRFKADSKGDKVTKPPTSEMESLELTVTPTTTASTAVTTTGLASKPTKITDTDTTELDGFPLSEFDLVAHDKRLKCQHCHSEMVFREDLAEKHLGDCDAYKASRAATTLVATVTKHPKRAKPADRDGSGLFGTASSMLRHPERLRVADILELDHDSALTWIFGSYPIERMRSHYGKSPMVVRSPVARFRAIEGELCELNVAQLLATVPQSTPITAMVPTRNGGREYKIMPCTSPSTALGMYEMDAPLVWRAPVTLAQLFVPHFAKELRCGPMVANNMHKAELLCVRERLRFDWQYHKMDSFVVCLRGKALWKLCGSGVELPPACFHVSTANLAARERMVAMQVVSLGVGSGHTTVPVPTGMTFDFGNDGDGDEDMDTASPSAVVTHAANARAEAPLSGQQMVSDAGSVVYIPAGTWYYVDGLEGDTVWLQFRMRTVAVGDIIVETVQQLVAAQCAMRERLVDLDGDAVAPQKLAISRMREIGSQLMALSANEVLPELLFTNEAPLATMVCDVGDDRATKIVTYDLRNPSGFQGGRDVHFFKRSTFRVTPLAALLRADELPPLLKNADAVGIPSAPPPLTLASVAPATASKKALHRKNKRAPVNAAPVSAPHGPHPGPSSLVTSTSNGTAATPTVDALYILYQGMGGAGDGGRARLKVQFWCNTAQQGMIEWIRSRDTPDAFRVSELAKVLAHHQGGRADFELLKMTVRFLCLTGYLTNVDVPI